MGHAGSFAGSVFFKQPFFFFFGAAFFFFFGAAFFFFFGAAFFFFGAALLKFLAVGCHGSDASITHPPEPGVFFLFFESLQPSEHSNSSAEQPSCHHKSRPRISLQRYTSGRCHMLPGNTSSC